MRLLYITNGYTGSGGLERVLSVKASFLAENLNYEVFIIGLNEGEQNPFYHFSSKINFLSLSVKNNPLHYVASLRKAVREINPDIISVCDDGLKGFTVPLWIGSKARKIYERHASIRLNGSKAQAFLMRHLAFLFDRFVVLTHYNLSEWKSHNLKVIPNPLSIQPTSVASLRNKKIICVGSISYNKGYDLLIEAWKQIKDTYPDWRIEVYGNGNSDQLKCERITFLLPVSDITSIYLDSSILVLPSRSEGFGMVLIEAMACGVPCVSFDCPCGPRDIITDGVDGFLAENGQIDQLADKISLLIEHPDLRSRLGKTAKKNVEKYHINRIAEQWNNLFFELTNPQTIQ